MVDKSTSRGKEFNNLYNKLLSEKIKNRKADPP